jgi:NAD(P)H-hydrate epimerase
MKPLPSEVYSVATVREIDRSVIADGEIAGYTLMTRAAGVAALAAGVHFPLARRWQIVCGAGNNAGDGYVVARLAASEGIDVSVLAVSDPAQLAGDAALAWHEFVSAGGEVNPWSGRVDATEGLLVDAMLGSGLTREVAGDYAAAVDAINASSAPVMALDIPTGLHGDSGAVLGSAVRADLTVTFVGLKPGLFLGASLPLHLHQISQPRNARREIFVVTRAERTRVFVSATCRTQEMPSIGGKNAETQNSVISMTYAG